MKALLFRLDALTDTQAVEKQLMVTSCSFAIVATVLAAISLWGKGSSIVMATDLAGSLALLLQLIWIRNKNRFLIQPSWLMLLMAGIIFVAVYFNGRVSVYWLYPTIVYSYFWLDIKQATFFSLAYTLLICSVVVWVDGFYLLSDFRMLSAGLVTMGLLYFFSLVRDNYIKKLAEGNSEYKSYTEMLTGKVKSQFEEIRQSEEKFRGIANAAQDAVVMINDEGKLTYWNPAAEHMFGYRTEEVLGRDLPQALLPVRYRPAFEKGFAAFRLTGASSFIGKTTELIAMRKDGSDCPIALSASAFKLNQRWNAVGILRDITERQRAQVALQESEKKYRLLIENLQEGVWLIDKEANTSFVNRRMAQMLGYSVEEMQGRHLFSFMDERGKEVATQNLARRKQGIEEQNDFELLRKDGSRIYTSMATSPILDEVGNYAGALAGVTDITERKQAQAKLAEQVEELRRWYDSTLGREIHILDLKREVNELLSRTGQPPRYPSAEADPQGE